MGVQKFDSHKCPTVFVDEVRGKPPILSDTCVDHYILLLKQFICNTVIVLNLATFDELYLKNKTFSRINYS